MKIPFKIRWFEPFRRMPKYIILHDVGCSAANISEVRLDTAKFQTNLLRAKQFTLNMEPDLNFHYVLERIGEDYEVILGRPFAVDCTYPDIPTNYRNSIHVCLMGSYDYDIPDDRLYKKLSYNILSPASKIFKIPPNRIVLHSEVSIDKELACPGSFFNKDTMIAHFKSMLLAK